MTIVDCEAALIVSPEGQRVLGVAAGLPPAEQYSLNVAEADNFGLWVRVAKEDGELLLLIR